ncbi:hypothetical protein CHCC14688_2467 [Bacillus licheniformis]|nr:hypothetical protein CHCC20369_0944 [Bacillus licheniformis]TWL41896.1 hypothetical protein CHCC15543_1136 [Bacillus licheniformis]TWM75740.1 hypothetical protein CHCC14688_2467 [Bacillus licheniformis]
MITRSIQTHIMAAVTIVTTPFSKVQLKMECFYVNVVGAG